MSIICGIYESDAKNRDKGLRNRGLSPHASENKTRANGVLVPARQESVYLSGRTTRKLRR
jgi:hypothetical protein